MVNRTLIFSTTLQHEAHIIKDQLESEGISALILNQRDSMYNNFGCIEVYVLEPDVEKAKSIVKNYRQ